MTEERISAISRLRTGTDVHGVTALVVFYGCPLRCKYCINRFTLDNPEKARLMTSYELLEVLLKDELYYVATGGGVTLGGGEPLLRPQFIMELMELGARRWHTTVETSLNIPTYNLSVLLPYIDEYIVDIKDMNPDIYQRYTGHSNHLVLKNLNWLVEHGKADNITVRLPEIEGYNEERDRAVSRQILQDMGISKFDCFKYVTDNDRKRKM